MDLKFSILLLAAFGAVRADTVELKTGEKIDGVFKQAGSTGVVIEVGGQPITFTMDKVRAIYLGAAPVSQQAPSAFAEAIDALKALQSITNSGVSYRDYAPRVLDAKVKIDRYEASPANGDDPARASVQLAMRYYELASAAWGGKITQNYQGQTEVGQILRSDAVLAECPSVKAVIAYGDSTAQSISGGRVGSVRIPKSTPEQTAHSAIMFTGTRVGEQPAILWICAASKIAEAEKH